MKRQHPTDPNLFWCPKCKQYKPLTDKYWWKRYNKTGWSYRSPCIKCIKDYRVEHKDQYLEYVKKCRKHNHYKTPPRPDHSRKSHRLWVQRMGNSYIIRLLTKSGVAINPETIELKRQAITIKRIERSMFNELTG
jgi:ribosomal protein L20